MWTLFFLQSLTLVRSTSLSQSLIDQLLFSSEPWRSSPVLLQDVLTEPREESYINCTSGSGESLQHLQSSATTNNFHSQGRSYINATLLIPDFQFSYELCFTNITKEIISAPIGGHLGKNQVGISVIVEDTLSGCRGIIETMNLRSGDVALDKPKQVVEYLAKAPTSHKEIIMKIFSKAIETGLDTAFKRLVGEDFYMPQSCGLIY